MRKQHLKKENLKFGAKVQTPFQFISSLINILMKIKHFKLH
jgi:hypothetical protein